MKKKVLILSLAALLSVGGASVTALTLNHNNNLAVKAEPTLRTFTINEAPTGADGRYVSYTPDGTPIRFQVLDGTFTPGGTFGTLSRLGELIIEYDQEGDIFFSNLYSVTINFVDPTKGIYYEFYYADSESHRLYSYSNDGAVNHGVELLASEHQVEIYNDPSASSTHTGNPNIFGFYTAGGEATEIASIVVKYTC